MIAKKPLHDYQIRIEGHLDKLWADWFERMSITYEGGQTILTGPVTDQAALHGMLNRIRDLNMTLVSVNRLGSKEEKQ